MSTTSWWRSLLRAVSWHRRRLAAVAAAIAVGATIMAVRPAPTATVEVWVAATDLPSGLTLTDQHLRRAEWPPDTVPSQTVTDPAELIGRTVAAPITAGSALTEVSVVSSRITADGGVLVPVTVSDSTVLAILQVGDRIDLLVNGPEGPMLLASQARVAALPHEGSSSGGMFAGSGTGTPLLVEVAESEAHQVASASGSPVNLLLR